MSPDESDQLEDNRLRRWRMVVGTAVDEPLGTPDPGHMQGMDRSLAALYESDRSRRGGLGGSAPSVARWLGDIREYFPSNVVQVMQRDAVERLGITKLLAEPELMDTVEANIEMVSTLIGLGKAIPETSRASARALVRKVVDDVERRVADQTRAAVTGALNRAATTHRPRPGDIDWNRTIARNLKHYQPEYRTVIPEHLVGHGRRAQHLGRDVIVAIDQSASMASSIVYASIFGSVLASMRSVKTSLVLFDTEIVDLTDELEDPVDVLFGATLGGGTDINQAIAYCQGLITRPAESIFVLISDLYEGGLREKMLARVAAMTAAGVQVIVLLALSDEGAPAFDRDIATALSAMGIPAFACTPDAFPELLAVAIGRGDIAAWATSKELAARGM